MLRSFCISVKVSCEQRFESSILLSVTCTASNQGVETDQVETTCSYDGKTAEPCMNINYIVIMSKYS